MSKFRIIPIAKDFATTIRHTRRDQFYHEVIEEVASGLGPCRVSLRVFKPGHDKRLLLSHSPFEIDNAYNQPGPIFIFADEVEEYKDVHSFPPEIKAQKDRIAITLIGYSKDQRMVHTQLVGEQDIDNLIEELFETMPHVEYLHARSAKACCFICKIVRV